MSSIRQTKRDVNAALLGESFLDGEPAFDTTYKRLHMGDGAKSGGIAHANYLDLQHDRMNYVEVLGTNDLTGNLLPVPDSIAEGMRVHIKVLNTNTGSVTLNLNTLGVHTLKKVNPVSELLENLSAGDFIAGGIYALVFDGSNWQWMASGGGGLANVSQGDLNTSVGSVFFNSGEEQHFTLPSGTYGFYPTINTPSTTDLPSIQMMDNSNSSAGVTTGSDVAIISLSRPAGSGSATTIKQRYMTSSPPFDMGDGQVNGFIFVHVNKKLDILSAWAADVPPWAYNGPTNIRANKICPKNGTKYRRVLNQQSMKDILSDIPAQVMYEPITQKLKNADMQRIKHPFGKVNRGEKILLLDPMDMKIEQLIQYQNEGGDLQDLFDYIKIDNERLKRKGPAAVHQVRFTT